MTATLPGIPGHSTADEAAPRLRRVEFFLPGKPVSWARAGARVVRTATGTTTVRHFTRADQRPYAALLRDACQEARGPERDPWDTPVRLDIECTFARPRSHFTRKGALTTSAPRCYTTKPDTDNLAKMVGDALNGVLWADDRQIVCLCVQKLYGEREGMRVLAQEVRHQIDFGSGRAIPG